MLERIKARLGSYGSTAQWILWGLVAGFSVLPLIRTMNDLVVKVVIWTRAYVLIERFVTPAVSRIIGSVLTHVFGVGTIVNGGSIYLVGRGLPYELYLSWNCIGWQGFILVLFSMVTGLQGSHSLRSKLKCIALGLEGIVLVNLIRIVVTAMLLLKEGYAPAIAFHDHIGLILTFAWLGAFWYVSNEFILEPKAGGNKKPFHEEMRDALRSLRLRSILPDFVYGKREMGLTTMVIILTMTALGGVAVLSAKVPKVPDPTRLAFEYCEPAVIINTVETNRILTHPDYTDLGPTPYSDVYRGNLIPRWVEMWNFYLHGPLEESYTLTGEVGYVVWIHLRVLPKGRFHYRTYIRFNISDVDEFGNSALVHSDTFRIRLTGTSTEHSFEGEAVSPYTFAAGHTIRISIEIFDGFKLAYVLEYDSESRNSYIDLPGIVVSENLTRLMYLALLVPPITAAQKKREKHEAGSC